MSQNVVVVESPAKAKTIERYLGKNFKVIASYGHVRDLDSHEGAIDPEKNFAMKWIVDGGGRERIKEIRKALAKADALYLATDPDREGEAISWHLMEELSHRNGLKGVNIHRVMFNEITRSGVLKAFEQPGLINQDLVDAYLARRGLDYLVGYTLSPVLWRRLPGARSAGRVQSVTLGLVVQRELEIEAFQPREYWDITVSLCVSDGSERSFQAHLSSLDNKKLDKFALGTKEQVDVVEKRLRGQKWTLSNSEDKTVQRQPAAPFITSTLQQEASRKLGFGAQMTMRIAQRLYEGQPTSEGQVGLITYMRTDGTNLSDDAVRSIRELIAKRYDSDHVPPRPRMYRSKAKNAQEAHEAIRPTDVARTPESLKGYLAEPELRLYELIWRRAVASQMSNAVFARKVLTIQADDDLVELRATGQVPVFKGFLDVYEESQDDASHDEAQALPDLAIGTALNHTDLHPAQHFTQPPPRYTEASLVRKMEELGVGRPSTYASTLQLLVDRRYVEVVKRRMQPVDLGMLVVALLEAFFTEYFMPEFSARMEERLDDISAGNQGWREVLAEFWVGISERSREVIALPYEKVRDALDDRLASHFNPNIGKNEDDSRSCPRCQSGRVVMNAGRYGVYFSCTNKPQCDYRLATRKQTDDLEGIPDDLPRHLGALESGEAVELRQGPYGLYVQMLPAADDDSSAQPSTKKPKSKGKTSSRSKPKRAGLLKGMKADDVTLEIARVLLSLPREIGIHPDSREVIKAGSGPFGPYLLHKGKYHRIPDPLEILTMGLNRAVDLLAKAPDPQKHESRNRGEPLGQHPDSGATITKGSGRYGPYVYDGKVYASIPPSIDAEQITLEEAVELLNIRHTKLANGEGATKRKKTGKTKSVKRKSPTKRSEPHHAVN